VIDSYVTAECTKTTLTSIISELIKYLFIQISYVFVPLHFGAKLLKNTLKRQFTQPDLLLGSQ